MCPANSSAADFQSPHAADSRGGDPARAAAAATEFISFAIGDEQYGVDIMAVREIKGWSDITHLPNQPEYVRGVLNLRGVMVPIVDLRCRFGQGLTETTPLHIVIVVQVGGKTVGLLGRPRARHRLDRCVAKFSRCRRSRAARGSDFLSGLVTHRQHHDRADRSRSSFVGTGSRESRNRLAASRQNRAAGELGAGPMKFVDNLRIATKILSVIVLLSCVTVMAIALGAFALYKVDGSYSAIVKADFPATLSLARVQPLPK